MNNVDNDDKLFEIIEGCSRGDRKCQQKVYEMFYGKMLGVCMRYTKDKDDAVDILQDGFMKVFANIKHFDSIGSFEGWIRKIMVNTAIDLYRKNKKLGVYVNSEYVEENAEEVNEDAEDEKPYLDISPAEVMDAVRQLSPAYRTVFNMYVVDGYSHKEIAGQLGISEGTSKSNFAKAKMNLKKFFEKTIKQNTNHTRPAFS